MTNSIVDYLKEKGIDSSYANRQQLASQQGINNYSGTSAQNTQLLSILRGSAPATTTAKTSVSTTSQTPQATNPFQQMNNIVDTQTNNQLALANEGANVQSQQVQAQTDFATQQIEQQKANVDTQLTQEATAANVAMEQAKNPYSIQNEQLATSGLQGSGYSETIQSRNLNTYQMRVSAAKTAATAAKVEYDNLYQQAILEGNSQLANIAFQKYSSQISILAKQAEAQTSIIAQQIAQSNADRAFAQSKIEADRAYGLQQQSLALEAKNLKLQEDAYNFGTTNTDNMNGTSATTAQNYTNNGVGASFGKVDVTGATDTKQKVSDFITGGGFVSNSTILNKDGQLYAKKTDGSYENITSFIEKNQYIDKKDLKNNDVYSNVNPIYGAAALFGGVYDTIFKNAKNK